MQTCSGEAYCMDGDLLVAVCIVLQDVLEVATLGELLPQLAFHLQTCLHRQQW